MLKRNGKLVARDEQLSLFDFARNHERTIPLPDPIRPDGREALARIPAQDGEGSGGAVGGRGDDDRRDGTSHAEAGNRAEVDAAAGARPGVGDDPGG